MQNPQAPADNATLSTRVVRLLRIAAESIRSHLWAALILAYLLGAAAPGLGQRLHEMRLAQLPWFGADVSPMSIALALMLFCGAWSADSGAIVAALRRPAFVAVGLAAAWVAPLAMLGLIASAALLAGGQQLTAALAGAALAAAMPTANSSVGWCQAARGNTALSATLVLVSLGASPLAAPACLWALSVAGHADLAAPWNNGASVVGWTGLLAWAAAAALSGFAVRAIFGPRPKMVAAAAAASIAALLIINYTSASIALPNIKVNELVGRALLICSTVALMCLAGILTAWGAARSLGAGAQERSSLMFSAGMKNTGAALVIAGGGHLQSQAVLTIMLYTLVQHAVASALLSATSISPTSDAAERESTPRI